MAKGRFYSVKATPKQLADSNSRLRERASELARLAEQKTRLAAKVIQEIRDTHYYNPITRKYEPIR